MGNANKRSGKQAILKTSKESIPPMITNAPPLETAISTTTRPVTRWSDVAAGGKSTHPDAAPIIGLLRVVELVEQVLLHLPMLDLLRARGVCRSFRDTIDGAPTLRQALYLEAEPSTYRQPWVLDNSERVLTGHEATTLIKSKLAVGIRARQIQPLQENPLLHRRHTD